MVPSGFWCSLNLIRFQKFQRVSGIVWYVLSKVVSENGMSFHSTHATSHALQPMQVVVSTNLQTSRSRCMPRPGEGVVWPEIISVCSALRSAMLKPSSQLSVNLLVLLGTENFCHTFSIFTKKPLNSGVNAFGSITVGVN